MIKETIKKLIRIYTPFIIATLAVIYGVMFHIGYRGVAYNIINEFSGHSILVISYILATCKHMCIWYKITNIILLSVHIPNIFCHLGYIEKIDMINILFISNIIALITFLIYRITVGITKILC